MISFDRRRFLTLAGAASVPAAFAADRGSVFQLGRSSGQTVGCVNDAVSVSAVNTRISTVTDFNTAGSCVALRNGEEGPYFNCVTAQNGRDLVGGRPGQLLTVALRVVDSSCNAVSGATVDVWSCGADGRYSGFNASPDVRLSEAIGDPRTSTTPDRLGRGVLKSDVEGIAEFETIYPGFYAGRAIHIHFKVHVGNKAYLTNQAFLPEDLNDKVLLTPPYNAPRPIKRVLNVDDTRLGNFPTYKVIQKTNRLVALLNIGPVF